MKMFILVLPLTICLCSCDVGSHQKDEKVKLVESLSEEELPDTDGDGIIDEAEVANGRDPFVADFPSITVFDVTKSLVNTKFRNDKVGDFEELNVSYRSDLGLKPFQDSSKYLGNIVRNSLVRKKISNLVYSEIFDLKYELSQFPTIEDAMLGELGCLSTKEYFSKNSAVTRLYNDFSFSSHKLDFNYKIFFQNIMDVNEISFIESNFILKNSYSSDESSPVLLKAYQPTFNLGTYSSLAYMKTFENKVSFLEDLDLGQKYTKDHCAYYKVSDFKYEKLGYKLKYSQVYSDVESQNAHIFLSTPKLTTWLSVSPEKFESVLSVLKYMGHDYLLGDNSELVGVDLQNNEITKNIHIEDVDDLIMKKGRWEFASSTGSKINDSLKAGEYYVIGYSKIENLIRNSTFSQTVLDEASINKTIIEDSYIGDEVQIKVELFTKYDLPANSQLLKNGYDHKNECRTISGPRGEGENICQVVKKKRSNVCVVDESNRNPGLANYIRENGEDFFNDKFTLVIKNSNRKVVPTLITEDGIFYRFFVQQRDIDQTNLVISLEKKISADLYQITRDLKQTAKSGYYCYGGNRSWQEAKTVRKLFNLKGSVIRKGIVR
jgi:hypothetical protein